MSVNGLIFADTTGAKIIIVKFLYSTVSNANPTFGVESNLCKIVVFPEFSTPETIQRCDCFEVRLEIKLPINLFLVTIFVCELDNLIYSSTQWNIKLCL